MARVAVLHNTLDLRGGADAICMHVCQALQTAHDVTLYTLSRASLTELNTLYGTHADVPVTTPAGTTMLNQTLDLVAPIAGSLLPLRSVILDQHYKRSGPKVDVVVSTANEFAPQEPSVQYIHYPQFNRHRIADGNRLEPVLSRLAGVTMLPEDATVVANSQWTAKVVERIYGRRPNVVHPPVDPVNASRSWEKRTPDFVLLGRIAPDKRVEDAIRIIEGVRAQGHDSTLHIVGSASRNYQPYIMKIRRLANEHHWVNLELNVSRDHLNTLLGSCRYGINAKPNEHFGTAVAEYVAAGMGAFVPNDGGQVDIVNRQTEWIFESVPDAIDTIDTALTNETRPDFQRTRFEPARFHDEIRTLVQMKLRG